MIGHGLMQVRFGTLALRETSKIIKGHPLLGKWG